MSQTKIPKKGTIEETVELPGVFSSEGLLDIALKIKLNERFHLISSQFMPPDNDIMKL